MSRSARRLSRKSSEAVSGCQASSRSSHFRSASRAASALTRPVRPPAARMCAATPKFATWSMAGVLMITSMVSPSSASSEVCSERYMLCFGVAT